MTEPDPMKLNQRTPTMKMLSIVTTAAALTFAAPATATTYHYDGGLYTINQSPGVFGTHLTGDVTFAIDTTQFTGTIFFPSIPSLSLTSGTLMAPAFGATNEFTFNSGVMTSWDVSGFATCGFPGNCFITSHNLIPNNDPFNPNRDFVQNVCLSCGDSFSE